MPKLLWANLYCLLDRSSGASMSVREQLRALTRQGFEVRILGATVFDDEAGARALGNAWKNRTRQAGRIVTVPDGDLDHRLLVTGSTQRGAMLAREEAAWFSQYRALLREFRPDIVYYYGGQPLDLLIGDEARHAGARVAFYLANGNYREDRWHRDVDLVITDTRATAGLYAQRLGIAATPLGKFIDPAGVVAPVHRRERLLFVNPTFAKGGAIVARLAILMGRRRPDILFEVVESRGRWAEVADHAFRCHGETPQALANVRVTETTSDMRPVYERARLLVAPSLWWESGGRVVVEALMNGIPAIVSTAGGMPEVQGGAGFQIRMPASLHEAPFRRLPRDEDLAPVIAEIERLFDDEEAYQAMSRHARQVAGQDHDLETNARRLGEVLRGLIESPA